MADARQLSRVLRVREVQHRLAQADEARARDKAAGEAQLAARIAQLAAEVAPAPATVAAGVSLAAAAHYRTRLQQSAAAAEARHRAAEAAATRAGDAVREARRDQTAVEKLLDRARADAALAEMRALQDAPPRPRPGSNRHDPC